MITSDIDTQVFLAHEVTGGGRGKNVMMYESFEIKSRNKILEAADFNHL